MPVPPPLQVPPPSRFDDFEELCLDLWKRLWNDDTAQMHGRRGQRQRGLDVFGRREGDATRWEGVQCKVKSQLAERRLTRGEIEREVGEAREFSPALSRLTIATTAPRDQEAQQVAREITTAHQRDGLFEVQIAAWEDIYADLGRHPQVLRDHYAFPALLDQAGDALQDYLEALWNRWRRLNLLGVREGRRSADPDLPSVYAALHTQHSVAVERGALLEGADASQTVMRGLENGEDLRALLDRLHREAALAGESKGREKERYSRNLTALEALAIHPRLVLLGGPGSGKSTFARFLALSMAGEWRKEPSANLRRLNGLSAQEEVEDPGELPWPHGLVLPLYVELRRFARSDQFPSPVDASTEHLLAYLLHEPRSGDPVAISHSLPLRDFLKKRARGALLMLDGLDEVPGDAGVREALGRVIRAFVRDYPAVRVLVTSRPYAYRSEDDWGLENERFAVEELAPFEMPQVGAFVRHWYRCLAAEGEAGDRTTGTRSADLLRIIQDRGHLRSLAGNPLMLTMMTDLHASGGGRLEGGRAGLYESSVGLLLNRWNENRGVQQGKLSDELGMEVGDLRRALEHLAFDVHLAKGSSAGDQAADISGGELFDALVAERSEDAHKVDHQRAIEFLHQRSGIVLAEGRSLYRFPHRSYQEYLAACYLCKEDYPDRLADLVREAPSLWREVVTLAVGRGNAPFMQWALLDEILLDAPDDELSREDPRFLLAQILAQAIDECELGRRLKPRFRESYDRVRQWLVQTLELGALSSAERCLSGDLLGRMGDPRIRVPEGATPEERAPQIDWVEIPAGDFRMGTDPGEDEWSFSDESPAHSVKLAAFEIARDPVTVSQYAPFVAAGYRDPQWWAAGGSGEWHEPEDWQEQLRYPNRPVVGVSWFEAMAYCRWIGASLPTEAQWERAAAGQEGRRFPWGAEPPAQSQANVEFDLGYICPVGLFPRGQTPEGVRDLTGNVWECCLDWSVGYESKPTGPTGGRDTGAPDGSKSRVIRGGSFASSARSARCSCRNGAHPGFRWHRQGFRPARLSPPGDFTP